MKIISLLISLILTSCSFNLVNNLNPATKPAYNIKEAYSSVGMIAIENNKNIQGIGTAFAINKNNLLTAGHVCSALQELEVDKIWLVYLGRTDKLNKKAGIKIQKIDTKNDICKLLLVSHGLQPIKMGKYKEVKLGDKAYIVGAPMGFMISITQGKVMNKSTTGLDMMNNKLLVSTPATGGHSGSPVLDDKGKLIGMLIAGNRYYDRLSFCVPLPQILRFIRNK